MIIDNFSNLSRNHYDYLVVGAGLTGAVFAHVAQADGKSVLLIDRRDHIAGNIYTERAEGGIDIHRYGAHIFHTSDQAVWNFANQFAEFNNYINSPIAVYGDELYNLPFNMNTFSKMWGVKTPAEAQAVIDAQRAEVLAELDGREPANLEEQALSLVGRDIYEKLIKGYTNYFNHRYQGIPENGYTDMVANMIGNAEVILGCEYKEFIAEHEGIADKTIYCGPIDEFFDYELGHLEYRSLRFETDKIEGTANAQGNAVVNYTERKVPYTRIIEHKHFLMNKCLDEDVTYVTREYPADWGVGNEPYYPITDERNTALYEKYKALAAKHNDVVFAGRLGGYKYYDMDQAIAAAFDLVEAELGVKMRW